MGHKQTSSEKPKKTPPEIELPTRCQLGVVFSTSQQTHFFFDYLINSSVLEEKICTSLSIVSWLACC